MIQLQITTRISECEENGWNDLLAKVDAITQSLVENPSAGYQIRTALLHWCDAVDCKVAALPPDENDLLKHNPAMMTLETFGTEI